MKREGETGITVYFNQEELNVIERIADKERRSRTQQIRFLTILGLRIAGKDISDETGNSGQE